MIVYIIKSSLCLMLLWVFYKLFLEKENIHFIKRFYLLFSLVLALIIPLVTLTYQTEIIVEPRMISETTLPITIEPEVIMVQESTDYIPAVLWSIYSIGVLIFGFRFIRNIQDISKKIRANERLKEPSHINVLLSNSIIPHTFLTYIFVPKKEFQQRNIPEEVLLHEKTHVLQKHTLDILFVEVLQVVFWFNPLLILIKKSVKLNHEFLADRSVLKQEFSIQNYFDLLLNYPNSSDQAVLSSPINYSLTKKRLQMMTKEFSKKRAVLKLAAFVPILLLCILFFNNEIVAKEVERPFDEIMNQQTVSPNAQENPPVVVIKDKEDSNSVNENLDNFQDGVTKEMVKDYNQWAKDLNDRIKNNKSITIRKNEMDRMQYIYNNMTPDQRKGAEQFPDIDMPPPPPAPEAPKVKKGEKSNIPPPPPPAPKVKKGEKSNIPPPPNSSKTPSTDNEGYTELRLSEKSTLSEEEREELEQIKAEESARLAESRELIAEAEQEEQEYRKNAIADIEEAEVQRVLATEQMQLAREQAENARVLARKQAHETRALAREEAKLVRELKRRETRNSKEQDALRAEILARKAAIEAGRSARKAGLQARSVMSRAEAQSRKAMKQAEKQARKVEIEARNKELRAELQERKAQQEEMRLSNRRSPDKFIEKMAKNDADFYYQGEKISAKQALKLVEESNNNLSIDASTKNGKSKVVIKD